MVDFSYCVCIVCEKIIEYNLRRRFDGWFCVSPYKKQDEHVLIHDGECADIYFGKGSSITHNIKNMNCVLEARSLPIMPFKRKWRYVGYNCGDYVIKYYYTDYAREEAVRA